MQKLRCQIKKTLNNLTFKPYFQSVPLVEKMNPKHIFPYSLIHSKIIRDGEIGGNINLLRVLPENKGFMAELQLLIDYPTS